MSRKNTCDRQLNLTLNVQMIIESYGAYCLTQPHQYTAIVTCDKRYQTTRENQLQDCPKIANFSYLSAYNAPPPADGVPTEFFF